MENKKTNLHTSFEDYKTPFEEDAWTHFQQLRKEEDTPKHISTGTSYQRVGFFTFLILITAGVVYFYATLPKETISKKSKIRTQVSQPEQQKKNIATEIYSDDSKAVHTEMSLHQKATKANDYATSKQDKDQTAGAEYWSSTTEKTYRKRSVANRSFSITDNVISKSLAENKITHSDKENTMARSEIIAPDQPSRHDEKRILISGIISLPHLNSQLLASYRGLSVYPSLATIKKTLTPIRYNHIGLKLGYATFEINGNIPNGNDVDKYGLSYQLEYKRTLNNILGIGATVGICNGEDTNNPQLDTLDYEKIAYAHLNIYLHLWNSADHQVYIKGGVGITRTKRLHSYFSVDGDGNATRGLQIGTVQHLGVQVEGGYSYRIYNDFWLGANAGFITGNDGAWYSGITLGMEF